MKNIRVMSQNLLCGGEGDFSVATRIPRFLALLRDTAPDILGTQETTPMWNKALTLPDYAAVGECRDDKETVARGWGEWNTLLYRKDRFDLLKTETFWLTAERTVPSFTPGSYYRRICTWALLYDKENKREILAVNTHLEDSDAAIREVQAHYLLDYLGDLLGKYPAFFTGDFNGGADEKFYKIITARFADAEPTAKENLSAVDFTYHDFGNCQWHIDYCFYDAKFATAEKFKILDNLYGGYVSDHYGLLAEYSLK